ncbi:MAG: SusC/RagA family TonB-linked outer membrane protein [Janthinobacterium lividum]
MKNISLLLVFLLSCLWFQASAQDRTISGRVTDASNNTGVPGATVRVANNNTVGTTTNIDGEFTLSAPASATSLIITSIGYTDVTQPITGLRVNVSLKPASINVGEVLVTTSLGIQRQLAQTTYATATLTAPEITQARPTNFVNGLAGKVSGLQISTLDNGVNPDVRITLRGTRSVTGNNQPLIVIDGIISTNQILAAINPDDIDNSTILKGANAAALYGSQASNGAILITTKRGGGRPQVTLSQTSQFESVSFLPKFQNDFGPGSPQDLVGLLPGPFNPAGADQNYEYQYQGFENQQFGPRYDGSLRPFGEPLADGSIQMLAYEARPNEKRAFFNTGYQAQNGVTFSGGDNTTKFFVSYQNVHNNGIIPKDKFDRNSFRFNASKQIDRLSIGFNVSYSLANTDVTSNADQNNSVYWNLINTTSMSPITSYKDWQNNPYANPNGYYNAYYYNPYFIIDLNRTMDRRNTLAGNIDLAYKLRPWLQVQYRLGTTNLDQYSIATQDKFTYNSFVTTGNTNKSGTPFQGYVSDLSSNLNRTNSDLFVTMDKTFGKVNVLGVLGNNVQQLSSHYTSASSSALAQAGDFNLENRAGNLRSSASRYQARSYSFYADLTLGYDNFFFLHGSGRYDNTSILEPGNRSFFYPSVDASFVFSNLLPGLKNSFLDYGKLRGGIAKVSQANIGGGGALGVAESGSAYVTNGQTFGAGAGFPYGGNTSFGLGGTLVQPGLSPETNVSTEAGLEFSFLKRRIAGGVTFYNQDISNLTVYQVVSSATGYSSFLRNAGNVRNRGYEIDLNFTPIHLANTLTVTLGGNFNFAQTEVQSLPDGNALNLGGIADASVYAIQGRSLPVLQGTAYERVESGPAAGLVKLQEVDDQAGQVRYMPVKSSGLKEFGNTQPKYKYGFNASISYKGLTLTGQGELRTGYVIYNQIGSSMDFAGSSQRSAQYGREDFIFPNSALPTVDASGNVTGYTPNTTDVKTAGLTTGGVEFWASDAYNTTVAENYVTSGMFFKIREISLSYTLPTALLGKSGFVKGATVNFYGRNLFTYVPKTNQWTDPEFGYSASTSNAVGLNSIYNLPPTRLIGANLNVTF